MNRWRSTLLASLAVVAAGALTLGAGAVVGGGTGRTGGGIVQAAMPPHDDDHGRHAREVFVLGRSGSSWLGVNIEEVSGEEARGARVTSVEEDSPAGRAGIREGDIITEVDGVRILGTRTLTRVVRETPPGRRIDVVLERDGRRMTVEARTEQRSGRSSAWSWRDGEGSGFEFEIPEMDIRIPRVFDIRGGRPLLGVSVDSLNPQLAEFLGVRERDGGLFIKEVFEETPAGRAGLKAGDVLLEADGRRIESVMDLREVLRENAGRTISLLIVRDRSERRVDVTLEESDGDWEEGRMLRGRERREIERALREARRLQREAMREHRQEIREKMEELRREERRRPLSGVVNLGAAVEI